MTSFGLLWLSNGGVGLQDSEPVVVQREIWWAYCGQNAEWAFRYAQDAG